MAACSHCIQKSEKIRESKSIFSKAAAVAGVIGLFFIFQWMMADTGGLMYTVGFVSCGGIAVSLIKAGNYMDQKGIRSIVGGHPKVIDSALKGPIKLLDSDGLSKHN